MIRRTKLFQVITLSQALICGISCFNQADAQAVPGGNLALTQNERPCGLSDVVASAAQSSTPCLTPAGRSLFQELPSPRKDSAAQSMTASETDEIIKPFALDERCTRTVVGRLPGDFIETLPSQEIRVERFVAESPRGPVCVFSFDVADASNPLPSGARIYLWKGKAQGLVFSDGRWYEPPPIDRMAVTVRKIEGLRGDVVVIQRRSMDGKGVNDHLKVFGFEGSNQKTLLDIAGPRCISVTTKARQVSIGLSQPPCSNYSRAKVFSLDFDSVAREMALSEPSDENVKMYGLLERNPFRLHRSQQRRSSWRIRQG